MRYFTRLAGDGLDIRRSVAEQERGPMFPQPIADRSGQGRFMQECIGN